MPVASIDIDRLKKLLFWGVVLTVWFPLRIGLALVGAIGWLSDLTWQADFSFKEGPKARREEGRHAGSLGGNKSARRSSLAEPAQGSIERKRGEPAQA